MRVATSFRFVVTNLPGSANRISKVVIPLPAGYSGLRATAPKGWASSVVGTSVTFQITKQNNCGFAIAAGSSLEFVISAKPGASATDRQDRVVGATAGKGSACQGVAFPTAHESPPWNVHGLQISSLSASPTTVAVGAPFTVTATFTNLSSVSATISQDTPVPTFTSVSGSCVKTGTGPTVNANKTGSVTFTCTPMAEGTTQLTLPGLLATTSSGTLTAARGINSNSVTVVRFGASFDASPDNPVAGADVTVTLRVTNGSPLTLSGVLPTTTSPCSGSGANMIQKLSGPTPSTAQTLPPGTFVDFLWKYRVSATASPGATFTCQAQAASNEAGNTSQATLVQTVSILPGPAGAFRATGFEEVTGGAGTVKFYWTYNDVQYANPHRGALIVTGPPDQLASCQPAHLTWYAPGGGVTGCDSSVRVVYATPPDAPDLDPFGTALVTGMPTGTGYYRVYQFERNFYYTQNSAATLNLEVATGVGDGRLFTYSTGFTVLAKPYPALGMGFFGGGQDTALPLYAVAPDGTELWRPDPTLTWGTVESGALPVPLRAGMHVVLGDTSGNVTLLEGADGSLVWRTTCGSRRIRALPVAHLVQFAPALPDDILVVATNDSTQSNLVCAFNGSDGSSFWTFGSGRGDVGGLSGGMWVDYSRNLLYVAGAQRNSGFTVWAIDTATGGLVWGRNLGMWVRTA